MLERETELIRQIIIESTINDRDAIRLNDVLSTNLPRGVKAYMASEAMHLLEQDFRQSRRLSAIAKGIGPTVTAERSLLRSLAMEYVFPRDEYLKLVDDTVHFLENYLCRPRWTLSQLMFEHEATISFETLDKKFDRIVDYAYFRILTARYARRNGWKEISAERFASLVARIDDEIVKQHSARELALLTKPIFDFLLFGDVSMNRPIPLGAILLFFEDKKMNPAKAYIERICQIRSRTQLSLNELIGMLEDLYQVETKVKEEVRASEEEIFNPAEPATPPESPAEPQVDTLVEESKHSVEDVTEPPAFVEEQVPPVEEILPQEIAAEKIDVEEMTTAPTEPTDEVTEIQVESDDVIQVDSPEPSPEAAAEETVPNDVTNIEITELEQDVPPVEAQHSPVVKIHELAAYAAERERLRVNALLTFPPRSVDDDDEYAHAIEFPADMPREQRERFLQSIFKNDEEGFAAFLSLIRSAQTWRDVQPFLRTLFVKNNLDILSSDVVKFIDAMQSRFHSSEVNKQ